MGTKLRNYTNFSLICRVRTTDGPGAIELEIDDSMKNLLKANEDKDAMTWLQERYKALTDTSTAWQEIFSQTIAEYHMTVALLFNVALEASFVTEGYLCLAAGVDFNFETARRYTLDMYVFSGRVSDNVSYLANEATTLDFHMIGKLGLRAGLKLEESAALIAGPGKSRRAGRCLRRGEGLSVTLQKKTDTQQHTSYQSKLGGTVYVEAGTFIEITYRGPRPPPKRQAMEGQGQQGHIIGLGSAARRRRPLPPGDQSLHTHGYRFGSFTWLRPPW